MSSTRHATSTQVECSQEHLDEILVDNFRYKGCLSLVILKTFQGLLIEVCVLSMAFNSPFRDFDAGMQRQPVLQVLSNYDFLLKKYVYISYTDVEASLKQSRATNM